MTRQNIGYTQPANHTVDPKISLLEKKQENKHSNIVLRNQITEIRV